MKDYKLSEIQEICKQNKGAVNHDGNGCNVDCPFQGYCGQYFGEGYEPIDWEIDKQGEIIDERCKQD